MDLQSIKLQLEAARNLLLNCKETIILRSLWNTINAVINLVNYLVDFTPSNPGDTYNNRLVTKNSNYIVTTDDKIILVDCSSGDIIVTFPLPSVMYNSTTNRTYDITVKRIDTSNNILTINAQGNSQIEAGTSLTITEFGISYTIVSNGIKYFVL